VIGSDIEVSVKVALDATLAGSSDDITKTINYEGIYWLVNGVMQGKMNLLETASKRS
jgi:dihydroneopterin aldolase